MRTPLKIALIVLLLILTSSIIALSIWEIPAPSAAITKSIAVEKIRQKTK